MTKPDDFRQAELKGPPIRHLSASWRDTLSDTSDHFEPIRHIARGALQCSDFAGSSTESGGQGSDALG